MNLNIPAAPTNYVNAMKKEADHFTKDRGLANLLKEAEFGLAVTSRSLSEFVAVPSAPPPTPRPKPAVWRFLARNDKGEAVAGEVSSRMDSMPHLVNLFNDPRVLGAMEMLDAAEKRFPELTGAEVALVRITGVLVEALSFQTQAKLYLIPILSAATELRIGAIYEEEAFYDIVRKLAERFKDQETPRYSVPPKAQQP